MENNKGLMMQAAAAEKLGYIRRCEGVSTQMEGCEKLALDVQSILQTAQSYIYIVLAHACIRK